MTQAADTAANTSCDSPTAIRSGRPSAHDFRRTAIRNLERAGIPRPSAKAMVGHKTDSAYERYAIKDEAMLRESVEKLAAFQARERSSATPRPAPEP
jgi:integrase